MGSQVILLLDLDHLIPLEEGLERLESHLQRVKRLCLRLITSSCNTVNRFRIRGPSFNFRFYSSSGYFVSPEDQSHDFLDFGGESLEKLEMALESRFESMGE